MIQSAGDDASASIVQNPAADNRATRGSDEFAADDTEIIVVEDDPVPPPPPASAVRRQEYRQLFARLRRG